MSGWWRFQGHPKTVPLPLSTSGGSRSSHFVTGFQSPLVFIWLSPILQIPHPLGWRPRLKFSVTDYILARPYFSYDHILRVRVHVAWGRMISSHRRRHVRYQRSWLKKKKKLVFSARTFSCLVSYSKQTHCKFPCIWIPVLFKILIICPSWPLCPSMDPPCIMENPARKAWSSSVCCSARREIRFSFSASFVSEFENRERSKTYSETSILRLYHSGNVVMRGPPAWCRNQALW